MIDGKKYRLALAIILSLVSSQLTWAQHSDAEPMRVVVTHFQDRSPSDDFIWMRESLADQLRALLISGEIEVVDYSRLESIGREQAIEATGLPDEQVSRAVVVAKPEIALTGEYAVEGSKLTLVVTASRLEPPEPLARVAKEGTLDASDGLLREAIPDVLEQLGRPLGKEELHRIRTVSLPSHDFQRWMGEGKVYAQAGRYPEAWYCYTKALEEEPDDFDARRRLARTYCEMGMFENAVVVYASFLDELDDRMDRRDGQRANWDGVRVETRVSQLWWGSCDSLDVDWEMLSVLEAALGGQYSHEPELDCGITSLVATLYDNYELSWGGWHEYIAGSGQGYEFSDMDTHATVDLFQQVYPHVLHLRRLEKFARYWRLKGRADRAAPLLDEVSAAWDRTKEVVRAGGVNPDRIHAIDTQIQSLLQDLRRPHHIDQKVAVEYTYAAIPTRNSRRFAGEVVDDWTWSEPRIRDWPSEFNVIQIIEGHDGDLIAVGSVRLPKQGNRIAVERLAYARSSDGETWTDPILFPAPINIRGYRNALPVMLARNGGDYILAWASDRGNGDRFVYVSSSPDLLHWSQANRTPAVGYCDMVELPDGRILIASKNTRITSSRDLVEWSVPQLAVTAFNIQMDDSYENLYSSRDHEREIRLIVADDQRIHLLAVVEPGVEPDPNYEILVHAVSDDGVQWKHVFSRREEIRSSMVSGDSRHPQRPIAAAAVPGGGVAVLLVNNHVRPGSDEGNKSSSVLITSGLGLGSANRAKQSLGKRFFEVAWTPDGTDWYCACEIDRSSEVIDTRPAWGGLRRKGDDALLVELMPFGGTCRQCYQSVVLPARIFHESAALKKLANTDVNDETWRVRPEDIDECMVIDVHQGDSELERVANSIGVLVQAKLRTLNGIVPLMAYPLRSEIAYDEQDFAQKTKLPHIRWADYVLQIRVQQTAEDDYQTTYRILDIPAASIVFDEKITCDNAALPGISKTISGQIKQWLKLDHLDDRQAGIFERELVRDPRSLRYLSSATIFDRPRRPWPGYAFYDWAQEVPDAGLLDCFWLQCMLLDLPEHNELRARLRARRKSGSLLNRPPDPKIIPLNPFKLNDDPIGAVPASDREELLQAIPNCLPLRIHTIRGWLEEGSESRALPHIEYLIEEYPDSPDAVVACARAYEYMNEHRKARDMWQLFLDRWPDDRSCWPYWYGDRWEESGQLLAPARARLAMAQVRLGEADKAIDTLRQWYESFDTHVNESPDRMLALSFYAYALFESGDTDRLLREIWPEIHAPHRGSNGVYRFPATVYYVFALMKEGRQREARDYLTYLLNEGYWYMDYHRAFGCPPRGALVEHLLRMQSYRPLMGG